VPGIGVGACDPFIKKKKSFGELTFGELGRSLCVSAAEFLFLNNLLLAFSGLSILMCSTN
jgi:hypothetical protein